MNHSEKSTLQIKKIKSKIARIEKYDHENDSLTSRIYDLYIASLIYSHSCPIHITLSEIFFSFCWRMCISTDESNTLERCHSMKRKEIKFQEKICMSIFSLF